LTASLDHLVILWDLSSDSPIAKFNHSSIVTSICFCSTMDADEEEKFVSGCLDKFIRIWSCTTHKVIDYINIKEYITAVSYFPTGDMIAIGTHNGRCSIYDCKVSII
jgi:WD40 repeat protein